MASQGLFHTVDGTSMGGPPQAPAHEACGDHRHRSGRRPPAAPSSQAREAPLSPRGAGLRRPCRSGGQAPTTGWGEAALPHGLKVAAEAHTFHMEASRSIYVRTEARERKTQEPPQPPRRKGNTWGRGKHMRHSSPLDPSWSPGCTRSSYSNRNGCRRPWQPRDPGSPWRPSGSGRLEPSCSGQAGPGVVTAGPQRPPHLEPAATSLCGLLAPHQKPGGRKHGDMPFL